MKIIKFICSLIVGAFTRRKFNKYFNDNYPGIDSVCRDSRAMFRHVPDITSILVAVAYYVKIKHLVLYITTGLHKDEITLKKDLTAIEQVQYKEILSNTVTEMLAVINELSKAGKEISVLTYMYWEFMEMKYVALK